MTLVALLNQGSIEKLNIGTSGEKRMFSTPGVLHKEVMKNIGAKS